MPKGGMLFSGQGKNPGNSWCISRFFKAVPKKRNRYLGALIFSKHALGFGSLLCSAIPFQLRVVSREIARDFRAAARKVKKLSFGALTLADKFVKWYIAKSRKRPEGLPGTRKPGHCAASNVPGWRG